MTHPLRGLLIAQFCGAFNDNAWKLMVALLAIRQLASTNAPGQEFETASQTQTTLAFVVFTFPLVVVSIVAGMLADRVSKRTVIILMKSVEVLPVWVVAGMESPGAIEQCRCGAQRPRIRAAAARQVDDHDGQCQQRRHDDGDHQFALCCVDRGRHRRFSL